LTENVLPLTLTLKHNNIFELTNWCHFSRKCADTLSRQFVSNAWSLGRHRY